MTPTFYTRLRGIDVECQVTSENEIHVTVVAATIAQGLPRISRFAGYCTRTLRVLDLSEHEIPWACTVADYYGFGLAHSGETLVEPRTFAPVGLSEARGAFNARVRLLAQSGVPANDSAQV